MEHKRRWPIDTTNSVIWLPTTIANICRLLPDPHSIRLIALLTLKEQFFQSMFWLRTNFTHKSSDPSIKHLNPINQTCFVVSLGCMCGCQTVVFVSEHLGNSMMCHILTKEPITLQILDWFKLIGWFLCRLGLLLVNKMVTSNGICVSSLLKSVHSKRVKRQGEEVRRGPAAAVVRRAAAALAATCALRPIA